MTEPTGPQFPPGGPPALPHFPPESGYAVPQGMPAQPGYDPLISADYGSWFQKTVAIVKRGWRPLAAVQGIGAIISFLLQAPVLVFTALATAKITKKAADAQSGAQLDLGGFLPVLGYSALSALVTTIVTAMVTIAAIYVAVAVATGTPTDTGAALRCALRRAFPLIGWELLAGMLILVGMCACVLPAFYVVAVTAILPAIVVFERGGALAKCFRLFHGDFPAAVGRTATIVGLTVAVNGIGSVFGMIINAVAGKALSGDTGLTVGALLAGGITVVVTALVGVFQAPLVLTAYADLRARYEPLSTPMLAQQLGLLPAAPMPGMPGAPGMPPPGF